LPAGLGFLVNPNDLVVTDDIVVPAAELEFSAIRAQGPGGQNVNKVSSAIQLKFDAAASAALPDEIKLRLFKLADRRISTHGVITIKAQRSRSQEKNRMDAAGRLRDLILRGMSVPKKRVPTRPSKKSQLRRLEDKKHRAKLKQVRSRNYD
jgi:ribosome-associated protein